MKFIDNLYFGEKASENRRKVLKDIKKKKYLPGVCIITLPSHEENLLDIIEVYTLLQPGINTDDMVVVGITYGKEEAFEVVRQLVSDSYTAGENKIGIVEIKKYLGLE